MFLYLYEHKVLCFTAGSYTDLAGGGGSPSTNFTITVAAIITFLVCVTVNFAL